MTKFFSSILLLVVMSLFCSGCSEDKKSIKIGYIACLTGKCSPLGVGGRDGVVLAAEQLNKGGGIHLRNNPGANIEIVAADTKGQSPLAEQAFAELLDKDVTAIIGPMTSQMGVLFKPLSDASKTVLLSPTVSTTALSKTDDYFFRIMTTADNAAPVLANYAVNTDKHHSFVIAYDEANNAFSDVWIDVFSKSVKKHGGQITGLQPLNFTLPMLTYAKRIYDLKPDALLIIANSHNTGMLIQQLNKLGSSIQVMGTEWSTTEDLRSISGRALNNAYFITSYNPDGREQRLLDFVANFEKRFSSTPSFAAKFGYEAMSLLSAAISKAPDSDRLKDSLINLGPIQGLQDSLEIDRYGDIQRDVYIMQFKDKKFGVVAKGNRDNLTLM